MHNALDHPPRVSGDLLRRLPTQATPPYNWQEFQRRARLRLPEMRRRMDLGLAAAAAVAVLCIGGTAIWSRGGFGGQWTLDSSVGANIGAGGSAASINRSNGAPTEPEPAANAASRSRALRASSRAVENWLASLPREPALVRFGTRSAVADLEDRIAQVDDMLTSVSLDGARPERLEPLQRERMQLVGSLAQVRYAEVVAAQ